MISSSKFIRKNKVSIITLLSHNNVTLILIVNRIISLDVKGLPPFIKWAISSNENYREAMEIWPCNDYVRRSEMAQVTLR